MEWNSPENGPAPLKPEILPPIGHSDPRGYSDGVDPRNLDPRNVDPRNVARNMPPARGPRSSAASRWASAPATYSLVGINCLVYLAMILNGVSPRNPSWDDLVRFGANFGPLIVGHQEWWRLLAAAFVHAGPLHLATNMWCLWNLGLLGEPLLGAFGMLAVYALTGIAGNLLSLIFHPRIVGVGASGAVFGLAGVLILLLKSPLLPVPPEELRQLRRSVIYFAVLNFVLGLGTLFIGSVIKIDNMAHLGGFLSGLALGLVLVPRIGAPKDKFVVRQRFAYGGMAVLLIAIAIGISSYWRAS